jgi:hypothetical protein
LLISSAAVMERRGWPRTSVACGVIAVAMLSAAVGCGGDSHPLPDPGPSTGLDRTAPLSSLTPNDYPALCDWVAGRVGSWGGVVRCSDGDYIRAANSEATCVSQSSGLMTCSLHTVADVEDCINGVVDGCSALPSVCIDLLLDCGMPL